MAWTQADIDALKAKIATANRRVTHGDTSVEKHDLTQMLALLKKMETEVAQSSPDATPSRTVLVQHGRGI